MVFLVVMGVCGCGKTTIAQELGRRLEWPVADADDFHTETNKRKMNQSIPLTDEDRYPWLKAIHQHMNSEINLENSGIIACSALKKEYRQILLTGRSDNESDSGVSSSISLDKHVRFIFLRGSQSLIQERLSQRTDHFMPVDLLQSQLDILDEPDDSEKCIVVDIDRKPPEIATAVINALDSGMGSSYPVQYY